MKKTETIKKNYEFKRILTKGKYLSGKYIECFYILNHKITKNRIGIAINSKIAKANKRNKIKRLIRENYKELENNIKIGGKYIFLWKKNKPVQEANYWEIKKDLIKIMKEMGLLINEEYFNKNDKILSK